MSNIFLSYARQDEETALEIYERLVHEGFSVWMDKKNLSPGQDWKTEIEKAINASDVFIACLSNHSVNKKGFVQAELKRALEAADLMPEGGIFIIPVRLDDCPVPHKLASLHWLDYFVLENREKLLKAISNKINVQEKLEKEVQECLLHHNPEFLQEKFRGVADARIVHALLSIAKREDELQSVRSRAVRGLRIFAALDASAWSELLPTASTDLLQEWIPAWCEDADKTVLTSVHIRMLLEGRRLPRSSTGFGLAVRKFITRGAEYSSAVFLPGTSYPAWEVKYDCVRSIIALDDADSLSVLDSFSTMEYWKARERIIEYIEEKLDLGQLSSEDKTIAAGILDQIITDGKTKEKTPTMRKAREARQKLEQLSSEARRTHGKSSTIPTAEITNQDQGISEDKSFSASEEFSFIRDLSHVFIVIAGPSGVGKRTVIQRMKERGLLFHNLLTVTTRPPRSYEKHGRDFYFVSKEEFARMIKDNEFIEHTMEYGYSVGTAKKQLQDALASGMDTVMCLDVHGAELLRKIVRRALLIFITTENEEELVRRLEWRKSETADEVAIRIAASRTELTRVDSFDYVIVNREFHLDETVDEIRAIISSEHKRSNRRKIDL